MASLSLKNIYKKYAGGVTAVGEIQGHPALQRAYETGKTV